MMTEWLALKTGISRAYWCKLDTDGACFKEAKYPEDEKKISWFDEMFFGVDGGITFPLIEQRPSTFLLTGPPGSGKSTLALELTYRLANIDFGDNKIIGNKEEPWLCLYISSDMSATQIKEKARSFGWCDVSERFYIGDKDSLDGFGNYGLVIVRGAESLKSSAGMADTVHKVLNEGLSLLELIPPSLAQDAKYIADISTKFLSWRKRKDPVKKYLDKILPDVVVIDSLNTLALGDRSSYFEQFLNAASGKTKMIFFILDSQKHDVRHELWEYMCDNVIRLDFETKKDYLLRNIEIVKARYQDHVLGKQQIKIYKNRCDNCEKNTNDECDQTAQNCKLDAKTMRRFHPYRHEGGIFIFPSIHYYLSKYKRSGPDQPPQFVETRPETLNNIIKHIDEDTKGIFPEGRCSAFVGSRGSHKSHLGYLHLLHRLYLTSIDENAEEESVLVISLRDDEEMTKRTMHTILKQEFGVANPERQIKEYETLDRLEVLYYPPGFITPEEFFHRMFMSVYRMKEVRDEDQDKGKKLTVLFNSLDQLSARFPLCAEQEIFIPGIIASLSGENVTSIFIAVDEAGQPEEQYGLIPMADFVLSFRHYRFYLKQYYKHLINSGYSNIDFRYINEQMSRKAVISEQKIKDTTVIQVQRFAGGEMARSAGILELVTQEDDPIYENTGLHFIPLIEGSLSLEDGN